MKFKFKTNVYEGTFYITNDKKEYSKLYKKVFNEHFEPESAGIHAATSRTFVIGVFDNKISTLTHELSHAAITMHELMGMSINNETCESFCYFIDHIKARCLEGFGLSDELINSREKELMEEIEKLKEQLSIITEMKAEPTAHEYKTGE